MEKETFMETEKENLIFSFAIRFIWRAMVKSCFPFGSFFRENYFPKIAQLFSLLCDEKLLLFSRVYLLRHIFTFARLCVTQLSPTISLTLQNSFTLSLRAFI